MCYIVLGEEQYKSGYIAILLGTDVLHFWDLLGDADNSIYILDYNFKYHLNSFILVVYGMCNMVLEEEQYKSGYFAMLLGTDVLHCWDLLGNADNSI